jgi:hypothetical protein
MWLPASWWRDRVRCCSGRIEEFGGDLLIAPGPATGGWLLEADRAPEPGQALARGIRVLRCARPPPGGDDPIGYPGICAEDWYSVALEAAAEEGAATVLLPPLRHPGGDDGVAEGAMASIRRGLARHPSIRRLWIVCTEEATAARWRAALFAAGRPHPWPGIAAGLMRNACVDGDGLVLPERCYRDRGPGCFHSDEGVVYYQFREEDGRLRLEVCETAGPERSGRHLLVEADGTSTVLPSICSRRMVRSPVAVRVQPLRRGANRSRRHRPGQDCALRRAAAARSRLRP